MRLHVVSLPHTQTTSVYSFCAYTQKTVKFCKMMKSLGYHVTLYAGEQNEAPCDEHVQCISQEEQTEHFGGAPYPEFESTHPGWELFNGRAVDAILEREQPGDYLCLIAGRA